MAVIVNAELIDDETLRSETRAITAKLLEAMPERDAFDIRIQAAEWARENLIERALLRQAAAANPALVTMAAKVTRPTRKEVSGYYRQNQDKFYSPEQVRAAHIVKNVDERCNEETARAAIELAASQLASGRAFKDVAGELSDCPGNGGQLGFFPRGQMVDEFEAVAFNLATGQVSPVFRTSFGWHIVKLCQRQAAGVRPLSEMYSHLEQLLYEQRKQQAVNDFVDQLRRQAVIQDIRRS